MDKNQIIHLNISNNLLNKSNSFKLEPRFEKLLNFSYWLHASPIACLFDCVNPMFIATSVNILTFCLFFFQVVNMLIALTGALQTSFSSSWSGFLPIENWSICKIANDSGNSQIFATPPQCDTRRWSSRFSLQPKIRFLYFLRAIFVT